MDDYDLIEASFLKQYGIRLRTAELEYSEFLNLMSCLMYDTPLGQIVAIRGESDPKILKTFTPEQRQIRSEWMKRKSRRQTRQDYAESMDRLFSMALA